MHRRRSFDEHVRLFAAYGARVAQLPPASWDRLRERCADLDSPAFASLVRRALLGAKSHELLVPDGVRHRPAIRVIAGISRVVQTGLALTGELVAEFEASDVRGPDVTRRRGSDTADPRTAAYIDASFHIASALAPIQGAHPGVAAAVRAAGQAVLRHDWLPPADFVELYAPLEPEIPFADLEPPADEAAASPSIEPSTTGI